MNTSDVGGEGYYTTTGVPLALPNFTVTRFSQEYFMQMSEEERQNYVYQHQLPGKPSAFAAISITILAGLVFICSSLVLLATRYTSGGQSATLVFLRSLLLSDILMATYGLTKMIMLLHLYELQVNFFLPESLFFTASLASTASLLSLNLDCFLKLTRPLKYAQVHKHTVITLMLLVWNAASVVGFLPLLCWYGEAYTFRFFSFFPWHFLLFNGLSVLLCALVCTGCMVALRRFHAAIPDPDPACFGTRSLEVRKYRHLHRTILMESCMWLAAYLPFFLYIFVTCRQCVAGDFAYSDASILYFVPVFLVKSMLSAGLQAFRTFHVHAIMNKLITDISHLASPPRNRKQRNRSREKRKKVATISYTNPLCELREQQEEEERQRYDGRDGKNIDSSSSEDSFAYLGNPRQHKKSRHHPNHIPSHHQSRTFLLDHDEWLQHQQALQQDTELTDFTSVSEQETVSRHGSQSTITGLTNFAFRPTLHLDIESSTKL